MIFESSMLDCEWTSHIDYAMRSQRKEWWREADVLRDAIHDKRRLIDGHVLLQLSDEDFTIYARVRGVEKRQSIHADIYCDNIAAARLWLMTRRIPTVVNVNKIKSQTMIDLLMKYPNVVLRHEYVSDVKRLSWLKKYGMIDVNHVISARQPATLRFVVTSILSLIPTDASLMKSVRDRIDLIMNKCLSYNLGDLVEDLVDIYDLTVDELIPLVKETCHDSLAYWVARRCTLRQALKNLQVYIAYRIINPLRVEARFTADPPMLKKLLQRHSLTRILQHCNTHITEDIVDEILHTPAYAPCIKTLYNNKMWVTHRQELIIRSMHERVDGHIIPLHYAPSAAAMRRIVLNGNTVDTSGLQDTDVVFLFNLTSVMSHSS